jgi:hypothetical protein
MRYNLEDETISAKEETTGDKIVLTVHGDWSASSILRAVSQMIIEKQTRKVEPDKMIELLYETENSIVGMYGAPIVTLKPETIEKREEVKEKKSGWFVMQFWVGWLLGWVAAGGFRVWSGQ